MATIESRVEELRQNAADALLNTAAIFITTIATITEQQEPMLHWDLPECIINLDTRRCARVYLVTAKLNLEQIQYMRLTRQQMLTTLTEPQKKRAGPLFQGLEEVASVLKARVQLLERVLVRYDIKEE